MDWLAFSKKGGPGRKAREKAKRSLQKQIERHEAKIAADPNSLSVPHWLHEIETFKRQLRKLEEKGA